LAKYFCEIPRNFAKLFVRNFAIFREINLNFAQNFVFREIEKSTFVSTLVLRNWSVITFIFDALS
jgi:hypothetical protein